MSVFATHTKPPYGRQFGVLVALAAVVAGTVYFGHVIRIPLTAFQLDAVAPSFQPAIPRETVFTEPRAFDDEGVVLTMLAGGFGVAVRLNGGRGFVQAYLSSGLAMPVTEGPVRIRGRLTEISCAYANSLFGGQCVPSVEIESIEPPAIRLQ